MLMEKTKGNLNQLTNKEILDVYPCSTKSSLKSVTCFAQNPLQARKDLVLFRLFAGYIIVFQPKAGKFFRKLARKKPRLAPAKREPMLMTCN